LERAEHGVDRVRADLVPALDELDELVDHLARLGDAGVVALERELVAAEPDRAVEPVAEGVEHAVAHPGQLGRDRIRDVQRFLHRPKCRPGVTLIAVAGAPAAARRSSKVTKMTRSGGRRAAGGAIRSPRVAGGLAA